MKKHLGKGEWNRTNSNEVKAHCATIAPHPRVLASLNFTLPKIIKKERRLKNEHLYIL